MKSWHKLSRIRRHECSFRAVSNSPYAQCRQLFSGRLVCDVEKMARETLTSKTEYTMSTLIMELGRPELAKFIPYLITDDRFYGSIMVDLNKDDWKKYPSLDPIRNQKIVGGGPVNFCQKSMETECRLLLDLTSRLNYLRLTFELSQVAGSIWDRSLFCQRAERNEYLLLHEFRSRKILAPPPPTAQESAGESNFQGGLVLEPQCGFYDTYILYLDFASLYPSIVQEFNLCFSTCHSDLSLTDIGSELDNLRFQGSDDELAILPTILKSLVMKRRSIKTYMAQNGIPKGSMEYGNLEVRQKALKLVANSIYGSLGFKYFRFYAPHIASTITALGRHILMVRNLREAVNGPSDDEATSRKSYGLQSCLRRYRFNNGGQRNQGNHIRRLERVLRVSG